MLALSDENLLIAGEMCDGEVISVSYLWISVDALCAYLVLAQMRPIDNSVEIERKSSIPNWAPILDIVAVCVRLLLAFLY